MKSSFFDSNISPIKQAGIVFAATVVFMLGGLVLNAIGLTHFDVLFPWSIATAFLLLFALLNSMLSLNADSFGKYWGSSMYSYLVLAFANGVAAWQISGVPVKQAGSYSWIYVVITFGFLVFLSMVNFMKKIVQFAEKEEWNQPRRRN